MPRKATIDAAGAIHHSEFVNRVLKASEDRLERRYALQANGYEFDTVVAEYHQLFSLGVDSVSSDFSDTAVSARNTLPK